jgi:hypothetical protein
MGENHKIVFGVKCNSQARYSKCENQNFSKSQIGDNNKNSEHKITHPNDYAKLNSYDLK